MGQRDPKRQLIDGQIPIDFVWVEKPSELGGAGSRNHSQYVPVFLLVKSILLSSHCLHRSIVVDDAFK
jgi:hypothetical protein